MHVELIAGSRDYPDLDYVETYVWDHVPPRSFIITGGAKGVDKTAYAAAEDRGLRTKEFPITSDEWVVFQKRAGYFRNKHMLQYVLNMQEAFPNWTYKITIFSNKGSDGKLTPGSQMMYELARNEGFVVNIISCT